MALTTFQESYYLQQNPDVLEAVRNGAFRSAEDHYIRYGEGEGRKPNPYFDPAGYLAQNTDVLSAVNAGVFSSGLQHYEMYGATEYRQPGAPLFDEQAYIAANPDVAEAVNSGMFRSGYEHFVLYGASEGRSSGVTPPPVDGQTFTLTTGQDIFVGTAGQDVIRGVAGAAEGSQDQTTLNSSDILDGGAGDQDKLVVNMTGPQYLGGATIKNIEELQIGTNLPAAATTQGYVGFDVNVNQGAYEVTGVNTLTYDQITTGEILVVQNVVPVAAGGVAPTMNWANENGSAAGTIATTYRQATVQGASDDQAVVLNNVDATQNGAADGVLAVGPGMESITITSSGAVAQNTLNNSNVVIGTTNYADTGNNNTLGADLLSRGTLTSVTLQGDTAIGKGAGVIAASGLTDRMVGDDGGITDAFGAGTASNLLSVGSRVTSVDASGMTANTFVRFVPKDNNSASNKTFIGGSANDYVEFENGNVTASGGDGDDTFAFINSQPNATFGENDVLDGGAGTDTIQLGLNGVGTFTIGQTELRNKTGIDVLDLRGADNTVTLSSQFVSNSDEGRVTIHTDRIVRTSEENAANGLTQSGAEDASQHVTNLTFLGAGDGITYVGGSGSDRLILNDATFNVQQRLDGGLFDGYGNRSGMAGTGDYDTLTVTTNGEQVVLDAQDLSNVSNFNGLVLTKNSATATYNITLTRSFLSANTLDQNDATNTNIDDTIFQIGTIAAANQSALSAGDTVTINVSDLLNSTNTALATAGFVPGFDVTALIDAGVNPNFIGNGGAVVTLATLQGLGLVRADAAGPRADVMASAAQATGAVGLNLIFTGDSGNTTSGFEIQGNLIASGQDDNIDVQGRSLTAAAVIAGSAGNDTLIATTGANISLAAMSSVEALNLTGTITMTADQNAQIMTNGVTAAGAADQIVIAGPGTGAILTVATDADVETYDLSTADDYTVIGGSLAGTTQILNMGANLTVGDVIFGGDGFDTVQASANTATTDLDNVSGVEVIELTGATNAYAYTITNASLFDLDTTAVTIDATALTTGTLTLDLTNVDDRSVTVNLALGNIGGDTITVDTTVANIANAHRVSGLSAGDTIVNTNGGAGGTVYTVDLATFNAATFAGDVNLALIANAAYVAAANDLILVRIGGSDANVYAVTDTGANGVDGTDAVVHLVGTHAIPIDGTVIV